MRMRERGSLPDAPPRETFLSAPLVVRESTASKVRPLC